MFEAKFTSVVLYGAGIWSTRFSQKVTSRYKILKIDRRGRHSVSLTPPYPLPPSKRSAPVGSGGVEDIGHILLLCYDLRGIRRTCLGEIFRKYKLRQVTPSREFLLSETEMGFCWAVNGFVEEALGRMRGGEDFFVVVVL